MENILQVEDLTKNYSDFKLDNVSFAIPKGSIMGLVGENGAGKSSTINAILNLIKVDGGSVTLLGKRNEEIDKATREQIGVVFDGSNLPGSLTPQKINKVLSNIYTSWDENLYFSYLKNMQLPKGKKIKKFSKGMKVKLSIAVVLAHRPKLLILDEATSGLDPIVREEILDMFLDFVQDEEHGILASSHITSDFEKVADYITFIHNGNVIFSKPKDELIYNYGIIKCGASTFDSIDKEDIIAYRKQDYEWQVLVTDKIAAKRKYKKVVIDNATIDEIMLMYVKGES